jgi:hypothetical protein
MTKEKVQNKEQTLDCLYFILYFSFGDWIVCPLFCTFSLAIRLSVLYFVLFLWKLDCLYFILYFFISHWIVCPLFGTVSLVIGLSVLYLVLFLQSLDFSTLCSTFSLVILNKGQTIQWPKKKYKIKYKQSND